MNIMIKRKILSAIISSLLFALFFSIPEMNTNLLLNLYYINFMLVVTYGVIVSSISDWISKKMFKSTYAREITSFLFHCLFGIVFMLFSLVSAILFFCTDRLLQRIKLNWWVVLLGLLIVVAVFFINII